MLTVSREAIGDANPFAHWSAMKAAQTAR